MKKSILLILFIIFLCGCGKVQEYPTIQDKLANMKTYRTNAEITYKSAKGDSTYNAVIYACSDERYRIEVTSPEDYKGNYVMYDGKLVWQYNPHLENNKISANPPDRESRREIILFSFLKNYNTSMETTVETSNIENGSVTVLEAVLPKSSTILSSEKLFCDNESLNPVKLVIYDKENKERIVVKFTNFEYNYTIEDSIFKM